VQCCFPGVVPTVPTETVRPSCWKEKPRPEGSGIASAIARAAARLPPKHTTTRSSLSGVFWMKGTNDDRPVRIKQGGFDDLFFNRTALGFGLPDNGEIEVAVQYGRTGRQR
jgi:hypothetical protein